MGQRGRCGFTLKPNRLCRGLALAAIAVALSGCVIPVFEEAPFEPDLTRPVVIGESERKDIRSILGRPDRVLADRRLYIYEETQVHAIFVIGTIGGVAPLPLFTNHVLFVEFSADGKVENLQTFSSPIVQAKLEYCMADGTCVPLRKPKYAAQAADDASVVKITLRANSGDAAAQFDLYSMSSSLKDGGYIWLCRSAANGYAIARFTLMRHYLGEGSEPRRPDQVLAYKWLRLFEISGGQQARDIVDFYEAKIGAQLTSAEIATAESLVQGWRPDPEACADRAAGRSNRPTRSSQR